MPSAGRVDGTRRLLLWPQATHAVLSESVHGVALMKPAQLCSQYPHVVYTGIVLPALQTARLDPYPTPFPSPQVLDARDPLGTRCRHLEHHLRKNARHKHLLLLLNKCDLVRGEPSRPQWTLAPGTPKP